MSIPWERKSLNELLNELYGYKYEKKGYRYTKVDILPIDFKKEVEASSYDENGNMVYVIHG